MKNYNFVLLFAISAGLMSGCLDESTGSEEKENDDNSVIPVTQTGAGTMGATINGSDWVAAGVAPSLPGATGTYSSGVVAVVGSKVTVSTGSLATTTEQVVVAVHASGTGTYEVGLSSATVGYASYGITESSGLGGYKTTLYLTTGSDGNVGTVTITKFDTTNRIVSGTFSFKAVNKPEGSSAKYTEVKNGVFDIKY